MIDKLTIAEEIGKKLAKKYNYYKLLKITDIPVKGLVDVIIDADQLNASIEFEVQDMYPMSSALKRCSKIKKAIAKINKVKKEVRLLAKSSAIPASRIWEEYIYWSY